MATKESAEGEGATWRRVKQSALPLVIEQPEQNEAVSCPTPLWSAGS